MHNVTNICMGCLSVDRKLQLLNEECKETISLFLDLFDHSESLSMCFECIAILKRGICFKKQVKNAYTSLFSSLIQHNTPKTLSNLETTKTVHYDSLSQIQDSHNVITLKVSESNENTTDHINFIKREEFCQNMKCIDIDKTKPLAFIKVEEFDVNDDRKSAMDAAFSDSDDEPLTVKKEYKDRRKKEKQGPVKKTKKEQPSGVVSDPRVAKKLKDLNIESGHIALVLLTWEEVEEERRVTLQSVQFTRHAHRCELCGVGYNHIHKLLEHNKKHSVEAGNEVCDICTIRCKTRAALASHRRRHRARWVCQWCGARYSQACVAADHCARAHAAPRPQHRCPRCSHRAGSLGALRMHIKSHSSRPECELCGKTFRDKSSLRTHAFVHRGEKEHACAVCDKRFMFKKQKEIHEITHKEHQHLYCHQCDVSFKNETSFYQHRKYNLKHIDPADIKHACKLCDKRFVKAKRLEEHNLAVHLKLAPVKCTIPDCSFACPSRGALRSHVRLVHRGARALRNHVCHRCGRAYQSKKSLDSHLRSHSVVLPPAETTHVGTAA